MFKRKQYNYFVSFTYHNKENVGEGNCQITRVRKISSYGDILEVIECIKRHNNLGKVFLGNYILLDK